MLTFSSQREACACEGAGSTSSASAFLHPICGATCSCNRLFLRRRGKPFRPFSCSWPSNYLFNVSNEAYESIQSPSGGTLDMCIEHGSVRHHVPLSLTRIRDGFRKPRIVPSCRRFRNVGPERFLVDTPKHVKMGMLSPHKLAHHRYNGVAEYNSSPPSLERCRVAIPTDIRSRRQFRSANRPATGGSRPQIR